jgi:hypothetical protein
MIPLSGRVWRVSLSNRYLQVRTVAASKGGWDLVKLVATIPPNQAFRPMDKSRCGLAKK